MKVRDEYGEVVNVFHIYWNNEVTMFSVLPRGLGGLVVYRQSEVEIIDPRINYRTVFHRNNMNMIAHWALIEKRLLDDVQESIESAYLEFLKIIKEEGIVEPDFY